MFKILQIWKRGISLRYGVVVFLFVYMRGSLWGPKLFYYAINGRPLNIQLKTYISDTDLKFVKKFTRPNFRGKELYTLKTRKSRLFLPAINSKNESLSVIWQSFG